MRKSQALFLSLILLFSPALSVFSQEQRQQQQQDANNPYEDEVVRITTNLVQVDAVVTDKDGRLVTDLKPEDFEISEDGKPQQITNFSYISLAPDNRTEPPQRLKETKAETSAAVTIPPARLKQEQVRRTIALIVDDLSTSYESMNYIRRSLRKYIDTQVQPEDLVAIMRTSSGRGTLQQFTNNKQQLYAAIDALRWYPGGRGGLSAAAPGTGVDEGGIIDPIGDAIDRPREQTSEQARTELLVGGTIGALHYIVRGLRELPGRKSAVVFTDSIPIFIGSSSRSMSEALRRLVDLSNRSSVVIYTIDARGLQPLNFSAADAPRGVTPQTAGPLMGVGARRDTYFEDQNGMNYIAKQTGGIFFRETNDFDKALRKIVEDQKGYYLIGYRPDESTFEQGNRARRFHNLSVKVKRPGLTVRSRTGFYGVAESEQSAPARNPRQQLWAALTSPFNSSGVDIRMTSIFGHHPTRGSYVRSVLYVNGRDLEFSKEVQGQRKAVLDIAAVTFTADGRAVDQIIETREVRVTEDGYRNILKAGLSYTFDVPVKQPGGYQLRIAVRDAASEKTGSANQFINVPDISKGRLGVSGITISGVDDSSANRSGQAGNASQTSDLGFGPAARRIRQGMLLDYGYIVYNAQLDKATGKPQVTTQARLFRDNKLIFTGKVTPLDTTGQQDMRRLLMGGRIQTGSEMPPGDYVLHITVTDPLGKENQRVVTQWTDFQIVK